MAKQDFFSLVQKLPQQTKKLFERIFSIDKVNIVIDDAAQINPAFKIFSKQTITIVQDKILNQTTIFNPHRRKRHQPQNTQTTNNQEEYDPFCQPKKLTPKDELGRLENQYAITAGNLSKMAPLHSLIIFKKHNFNELNNSYFQGALQLANIWFQKMSFLNKKIKHKILVWNYNYRAGASVLHPHLQVLAYTQNILKITKLQKNLNQYTEKFKSSYFYDYFSIAQKLKLAKKTNNFMIWPSFTPIKDKGINFYGDIVEGSKILWLTIKKLAQKGAAHFNLIYVYDLQFGIIVDRGETQKKNSDIGSLELYNLPIVSQEPQDTAKIIF